MSTPSTNAEFTDPQLVAVFDTLNAYRPGSQPDSSRELIFVAAR